MKKGLLILAALFYASGAFAEKAPLTRVIKVRWDRPVGDEWAVQRCADIYYTFVEILVPTDPPGLKVEHLAYYCPDLKMDRKESIEMDHQRYTRVRYSGIWDHCDIVVNKPVTENSPNKSRFTVRLMYECF